MKAIVVNITSWRGISPGAEHYYAKLMLVETTKNIYKLADEPHSGKELEEIELRRTIADEEARYLNKKEHCYSWRAGDSTGRFNNMTEIKTAVAEYMKEKGIVCDAVLLHNWDVETDDDFIINIKKEPKKTNKKIMITYCNAFGKQFENLTPNSVHEVIEAPERYKKSKVEGVWVMGVGEPVKVLEEEYITVK